MFLLLILLFSFLENTSRRSSGFYVGRSGVSVV